MANPLFNMLMGGNQAMPSAVGNPQQINPSQMSFQDALQSLQANPAQMIRQAGYNVPDEIANNPQAAAMHLIQSGQVGGPVMQRIQPMLNMLMGRR